MHDHGAGDADQAAGLRRIFGVAPARVAPILVDPQCGAEHVASIVRLAQACANIGERTLILDCARLQVAASLGLRARFDLAHALRGECLLQQVRLDAGANLGVIPAARAAQVHGAANEFISVLGYLTNGPCPTDLVLMIVEPAQAALLKGTNGDVIVPLPRDRAAWSGALRAIRTFGAADIAGFRLLFPAWDADTAARLYSDLVRACRDRLGAELRYGGAVQVAHDWPRIARAMSEWDLLRLPRPQTVRTF